MKITEGDILYDMEIKLYLKYFYLNLIVIIEINDEIEIRWTKLCIIIMVSQN